MSRDPNLIIVDDTETTGFSNNSEIVQQYILLTF